MLRGLSTYLSLFESETTLTPSSPVKRKGRDEYLHLNRNTLLAHRYYYLIKIKRSNFPDTLNTLKEELFISHRTIVDTISVSSNILKELNSISPDVNYFRKKYPHLIW